MGTGCREDVFTNTVRNNGAENNMNGYTETEKMLDAHKDNLDKYGYFNAISTYRTNNAVPSGLIFARSPWFVPSVGQWFDVMVNICGKSPKTFNDITTSNWSDKTAGTEMWNAINSQLSKVDKPLTLYPITGSSRIIFVCSSEVDAEWAWNAVWSDNATNVALGSIVKFFTSSQRVVRPFFVF